MTEERCRVRPRATAVATLAIVALFAVSGAQGQVPITIGVFLKHANGGWVAIDSAANATGSAPSLLHDYQRVQVERAGPQLDTPVFRWGDTRRIVFFVDPSSVTTNPIARATLRLVGPDDDPFTYDPTVASDAWGEERPRVWMQSVQIDPPAGPPPAPQFALHFDVNVTPSPGLRWNAASAQTGLAAAWDATPIPDVWDGVGPGGYAVKDRDGDGVPDDVMGPDWAPGADGAVDGWDVPLCERDRYWEPGYWTLEGIDFEDTAGLFFPVDFADPGDATVTLGTPTVTDYFVVAHPLNLEYWEVPAGAPTPPRRFSFFSFGNNIVDEQDMIYDSAVAVPAAPREQVSTSAETAAPRENYWFANGNRDFLTRNPSRPQQRYGVGGNPPVQYRDCYFRYDYTDPTDDRWLTEDANRGLGLPIIDLFGRTHGAVAELTAEMGANRDLGAGSGLYVENASHTDFGSLWPVGGVLVKAEPASLVPTTRVIDVGANAEERGLLVDFRGRPVPNTDYPAVPADCVQITTEGGTDLVRGGISLPWTGGADANPVTNTADPNYRKLDVDAPQGPGNPRLLEDGELDGAGDEAPVRISIRVPRYQPALVPPEVSSLLTAGRSVYESSAPVENTNNAADPRRMLRYLAEETNNGDLTSPRAAEKVIDYRKGLTTGIAEDESFMMKVYVDLNGNGQLDIPDPQAFRTTFGAEPATDHFARRSYGHLMAEPYRCFAVRLVVDPDPERVNLTVAEVDLGTVTQDGAVANGEPAGYSASVKVGLANMTNRALGVLRSAPGGRGYLSGVGFLTSHFMTEGAELGVVLPGDRIEGQYDTVWRGFDADGNGAPELWSMERAKPDAAAPNSRTFLDYSAVAPALFPHVRAFDVGEASGLIRLFTAPFTPMGTYTALGRAFTDNNDDDAFSPGDILSDERAAVKVRVSEAPLPPRYGIGLPLSLYNPTIGPSLVSAVLPSVDPLPPFSQIDRLNTANINTAWTDADPAVAINLTTAGTGVGGHPLPDYGNGYGRVDVVFSSNRVGSGVVGPPNFSLWQAPLTPDVTDLRRPRLVPGDAVLFVGDPTAIARPPSAAATVQQWNHATPSFDETGEVIAWTSTIWWGDPATNELTEQHYIGVATRANAFADVQLLPLAAQRADGVRPFVVNVGNPAVDGLHLFFSSGAADEQRIYHAALLPTGEFAGPDELPLIQQVYPRYRQQGNNPRVLAGTEFASEPWVASDYYLPPGGGTTVVPAVGVLFTGRSVGKGDDDIFYARLDPANGFAKQPFGPTDHNGRPRIFSEGWVDTATREGWPVDVLEPLPEGAIPAERGTAGARNSAFRSRHVDWRWDHAGVPNAWSLGWDGDSNLATPPVFRQIPWITVRVQEWDAAAGQWIDVNRDLDNDGTLDGPMVWAEFSEDTDTGLLYATNAQGVRHIEIDPAAGVVRFLEALPNAPAAGNSTIPERGFRVVATYVPQALRMTDNSVDDGQPAATFIPPRTGAPTADPTETIRVPEPFVIPGGAPNRPIDFLRPERLVLVSAQTNPTGESVLYYQTFSTPLHPGDTTAWDLRDRTVAQDTDDDVALWATDPGYIYTDSGPVPVPVQRGVLESQAAVPVAMPYVWWTNRLRNAMGYIQVPLVDYSDAATPAIVLGPTMVTLFFSGAGAFAPVDPSGSGIVTFDPDGDPQAATPLEPRYAEQPPADVDLYYGAFCPRTIPTRLGGLDPAALSELQ